MSGGSRKPSSSGRIRQVHFNVLTRLGSIDGRYDCREVALNPWPTGGLQHNDRQTAIGEILLVLEVAVGGDEDLKSVRFRGSNELPVFQP